MLIAVAQDATGKAQELALSYADAIGGTRAGVILTDFRQETETDLFGEQNVLCGGTVQLIQMGYDVLVAAGYDPVMAYFEVCHELKLIVDLIYREGPAGMLYSISDTAKWGCVSNGPRLIDDTVRERMMAALADIQDGSFAKAWVMEDEEGRPVYNALLDRARAHPMENVGAELRALMPFIQGGRASLAEVSGGS
jgi:ketol-acid reductoisomerase